jgi:hypothetical protein
MRAGNDKKEAGMSTGVHLMQGSITSDQAEHHLSFFEVHPVETNAKLLPYLEGLLRVPSL